MTTIEVTEEAGRNLADLIDVLSLPATTPRRVVDSIIPLATAPRAGKALQAPLAPARWILGPWPWMVIVYVYVEADDVVRIVAIQDGRARDAASHSST